MVDEFQFVFFFLILLALSLWAITLCDFNFKNEQYKMWLSLILLSESCIFTL